MKKIFLTLIGLVAIAVGVQAQEADTTVYFGADCLPDPATYLPAVPDSTCDAFHYDVTQYFWGRKQQKTTATVNQAIADAQRDSESLCELFSAAFTININPDSTPAIYELIDKSIRTIEPIVMIAKQDNGRTMPADRFRSVPPSGEDMTALRREGGSYPSMHAMAGWLTALLLAEINPAQQNAILKRGYDYGQSRVILGTCWQSDVTAGRLIACAGYARLQADPIFLQQMALAVKEYLIATGQYVEDEETIPIEEEE